MKQDKLSLEQQKLVIDNINLVHKVIRSVVKSIFDYEELFACGCEFLCRAALKYDKSKSSCSFSTFAYIVIKNDLLKYLRKENRFRLRNDDFMFMNRRDDALDKILDKETRHKAFKVYLESVSNVPIRRGLLVLYEHVVNNKSLDELAKKLEVSRNTAYLNMVLAREYIRGRPIEENRWLLHEGHHLLAKEESDDE